MWPVAEITNLDLAFGGGDIKKLMPLYADIPAEFKRHHGTKWNRLTSDWFFCGVKNLDLKPRDGVETSKALRHIKAILSSFEPKHEHKEAGVAFLLDQWFSDGTWERAK
jgi:hypothetical protein